MQTYIRSLACVALLFLTVSEAQALPLDNPVTWLSTSSMSCPVGLSIRGYTVTCNAVVEYLNASYVLPQSSVQARHDGCTHGLQSACATTAIVTNASCTTDVNNSVTCEYPIAFVVPTVVGTGGVYTISLTRVPTTDSFERRIPETLIVQGAVACGAVAQSITIAAAIVGIIIALLFTA
eukprot:GILI01024566.1.p1 GENE.GILI01024566.1~~GILI01024566.1.p1  ORF type:complete len:179 (+),score=20.70 GILI01024566.1:29-565(+)